MTEYIKREAVSQVLQGIANGLLVGETEASKAKDMKSLLKINAAKEILKTVDNDLCFIPAVDVQPVKRAKWDFQGYQLFKCTNCKEMFTQDQLEAMQNHIDCEECAFPNYCPNCGADMRELIERR